MVKVFDNVDDFVQALIEFLKPAYMFSEKEELAGVEEYKFILLDRKAQVRFRLILSDLKANRGSLELKIHRSSLEHYYDTFEYKGFRVMFIVLEVANVWKLQNSYDIYDGELVFMNKKMKINVDKEIKRVDIILGWW
jgi:DNA-directed RNA polymerase delta subunit